MLKSLRIALPAVILLAAAAARAGGQGQEDLDKATDTKLAAKTISDLSEVIRLTESAVSKGLDKEGANFANKLLTSTLLQRAQESVKQILSGVSSEDDYRAKWQFAMSDLQKAVEIDPKLADAHLLIVQLQRLPGGDLKKARRAVDAAIAIGLDEPAKQASALLLRAELQEQPEKKLADLNKAVTTLPNDPRPYAARGRLLADLGKLDDALSDLDKAVELSPKNSGLYEAKAIVLARQKKYEQALATLDKAHQVNPESVMPLVQRARVHSEQNNYDSAIADLGKAITIEPKNALLLLMRASAHQQKGGKDKAMADVDEALKLQPDMPVVIRTRALFLADRQRFDEAISELEKLRKADPKDTLTVLQLAAVYGAQKKNDKAIEAYSTLLAAAPNDPRALHGRGDAYLNMGKQAEAIADYEKAVKIDPKNQGLLNNFAWVLATSPDEKLRDGRRAIELATKAAELTQYKAAYILSTLAAAYAETGDFDSAVKWSSKAVEIDGKEHGDALKKELESYKVKKPWRELLPESKPETAKGAEQKVGTAKKGE